jgi:hypothetical protein
MVNWERMLKLLIALALVVGSVQCAAACTPAMAAQPTCHHHKQAPSCAHELIPATIVQSTVIAPSFISESVAPQLIARPFLAFYATPTHDPSPPGATVPPSTILRI